MGTEVATKRFPAGIAVSAVGMTSATGVNALQTFISVRAGITRIRERPEIYHCLPDDPVTEDPEPVVASAVYHLDTRARDEERPVDWLATLAAQAFRDLREGAKLERSDEERLGLFMSLPPARSGWSAGMEDEFALRFHDFAEKDWSPMQFAFVGHSGALSLCEDACALIREGKLQYAAVGGVDSYLFPDWLEGLDQDYRIKSSRNMDGFVPGEAAAFFLLEPLVQARRRKVEPWAIVKGTSVGFCQKTGDLPNTGVVLSEMIRGLLAGEARAPVFVCDLNGEMERMREWGYTLARLGPALQGTIALEHPATSLGDVGAASGASLVALAVQFLRRKYLDANTALVWTASDGGERRALLLERPEPAQGQAGGPRTS